MIYALNFLFLLRRYYILGSLHILKDILRNHINAVLKYDKTAAVKVSKDLHSTKRSPHITREFHHGNEQVINTLLMAR